MIFVTVGTHEQQFNRLIKKIDQLKKDNVILEEVFMQIGYSTYQPNYCVYEKFLSYEKMNEMYKCADIIVTHGGPASFMKALEIKKMPIVVPRQEKFHEHVNNHQVEFVKLVEKRFNSIIGVYNIEELEKALKICREKNRCDQQLLMSNNKAFNDRLNQIILDFDVDKRSKI